MSGPPDAALQERVACGIACGRRYGLTWASTLTALVAPQPVISPVFFRQPGIRAEPTTAGIPEGDRRDRLSPSLPPPARQLGRKTPIP